MPRSQTLPQKFAWRRLGGVANILLWTVLCATFVAKFVPFQPEMPESGLDPSWRFGMNQAVAQQLAIGKDIIFTFGPYASVYTRYHHPATDRLMLWGSLYLALSYAGIFVVLAQGVRRRWMVAALAGYAGLWYLPDALLFSLPLLAGLLSFKLVSWGNGKLARGRWALPLAVLAFAPFGLLPLVKGTLLILCAAVGGLCLIFFLLNRQNHLALATLLAPSLSMLLFWFMSGQAMANLPGYFLNMAPIVSGYTEAMASDGESSEIWTFLFAGAALLLAVLSHKPAGPSGRLFLACVYFVFLFIAFKGGFVRHDGHATIAGMAMMLAALLLPLVVDSWALLLVLAAATLAWHSSDKHYIQTFPGKLAHNFETTYTLPWRGLVRRLTDADWPKAGFDAALRALRQEQPFPELAGSTDIYSYNQAYLIASPNRWNPRPIPQSYSAYTPELADKNRNHLTGAQAPDNIIFKVEPIDARLPSLEDGASWPVLLHDYQPTRLEHDFLFLKRLAAPAAATPAARPAAIHPFGESVPLPGGGQPVFATVNIEPTLLGRVAGLLYKPSQLLITLELEDGSKKPFRLLAGMAKSGFLISPLVATTTDFSLLYLNPRFLANQRVTAMTITPRDRGDMLWKPNYSVSFSPVSLPAPLDSSVIHLFDAEEQPAAATETASGKECYGSIDAVNDLPATQLKPSAAPVLKAHGWLVNSSGPAAALPEATYAVLTDAQGKRLYFKTHTTQRQDIGVAYGNPALVDAGYASLMDVSALEGSYRLGLALKKSGKILDCPQFDIPLTLTR